MSDDRRGLSRYVTPAEAAEILGISRSTITRCKQMGAPVRYVGTCGKVYRIDPEELSEWMNDQGQKGKPEQKLRKLNLLEMRAKRHEICG